MKGCLCPPFHRTVKWPSVPAATLFPPGPKYLPTRPTKPSGASALGRRFVAPSRHSFSTGSHSVVPPSFTVVCLPAQQCSASCGKGTRMRYVSCRDNQGGVAEESACAHLPKPPAREVCSVVACGQWKVLEWTAVRHHKFICSPSSKLPLPLITWSSVQFGVELAQDLRSHSNRSASHYVGRQCR